MQSKAWISGIAGTVLTSDERAFFADERPWGFILFGRNIGDAAQLSDLCASLAELGGPATVPIFIDQEGGRVQRLKPPLAPNLPAGRVLGEAYARDAAAGRRAALLHGMILGRSLRRYGINADCIPCLDLAVPGAHSVIGDRALAADGAVVAELGRQMADGAIHEGVLPVMKHLPGHGRVDVDSHLDLPRLSCTIAEMQAADLPPFCALADLPAAMTAHILFESLDARRPATLSPLIIENVIRQQIGFDGLLMTDDISMKALRGDVDASARQAIAAGCDLVLHCNGLLNEMRLVAGAVPELRGRAAERAKRAATYCGSGASANDSDALIEEYQELVRALV